jgi:hypothetical protein
MFAGTQLCLKKLETILEPENIMVANNAIQQYR